MIRSQLLQDQHLREHSCDMAAVNALAAKDRFHKLRKWFFASCRGEWQLHKMNFFLSLILRLWTTAHSKLQFVTTSYRINPSVRNKASPSDNDWLKLFLVWLVWKSVRQVDWYLICAVCLILLNYNQCNGKKVSFLVWSVFSLVWLISEPVSPNVWLVSNVISNTVNLLSVTLWLF